MSPVGWSNAGGGPWFFSRWRECQCKLCHGSVIQFFAQCTYLSTEFEVAVYIVCIQSCALGCQLLIRNATRDTNASEQEPRHSPPRAHTFAPEPRDPHNPKFPVLAAVASAQDSSPRSPVGPASPDGLPFLASRLDPGRPNRAHRPGRPPACRLTGGATCLGGCGTSMHVRIPVYEKINERWSEGPN